MVSDEERNSLSELLYCLNETDLFSLASTTTGGKITPVDKNDAVNCIVLHSDSAKSVLKRRKISKDFLFNYLHEKKVGVLASDEKPKLIECILQLWKAGSNLPKQAIAGNGSSNNTIYNIVYNNNTTTNYIVNQTANSRGYTSSSTHSSTDIEDLSRKDSSSLLLSEQACLGLDENTVNLLALRFTEWFYNTLNRNFKGGLIAVNSEHFWKDADFTLRIKSRLCFSTTDVANVGSNIIEEEHVNGVEDIIMLLNKVKSKYQIYFSPNLCFDGVRGKSDKHGGVLVLSCGTLHKDVSQLCGAFEQVFLIFHDPLTKDNWKIKRTELHLISVEHNNMLSLPTINDTSLKTCIM